MRISDWSSDVCSSDLRRTRHFRRREPSMIDVYFTPTPNGHKVPIMLEETGLPHQLLAMNMLEDRKSVVQGKSVSVRVDLGGRRIIKKKKKKHTTIIKYR